MPSGKQLSFSYGEVSETLRFRVNEFFYANALSRLRNGFVRKEGGVSNRAGFKFLGSLGFGSVNFPKVRETPGQKLLSVVDPVDGRKKAMLYVENPNFTSVGVGRPSHGVYDDKGDFLGDATTVGFTNPWISLGGSAKDAQVTQFDEYTIISFGGVDSSEYRFPVVIRRFSGGFWTQTLFEQDFQSPVTGAESATFTNSKISGDPSFPSTYLIMAELEDGSELYYFAYNYTEHPTSSTHIRLQISNVYNGNDVIRYNIYRSAGSIDSAFGFVGSITLSDSATTTLDFNDFVLAADILSSPPINPRLWATQYGGSFGATQFQNRWVLRDFDRCMIYEQKLFIAYNSEASGFKEGTIGVSRLGSPRQLHMPNIYNNVNAFEFKVPLVRGDKVVAMLGAERPLIFTKTEVIMLRGTGEEGIITPTGINPKTISNEGCSDTIQPVETDRGAIFVNYDHSKIIRIFFSISGDLQIEDITAYSDHLIEETIVDLQYTRGNEDIIWALRADGKIVSITIGQAGYGFALHETDGNIYSIATITTEYDYDRYGEFDTDLTFIRKETEGIAALINRGVSSTIEVIKPRDDQFKEGYHFADSYVAFGTRLTLDQNGIWTAKENNDGLPKQRPNISILGSTYEQDENVLLYAQSDLSTTIGAATYVDFFYDDGESVRTYRWTRTGAPNWTGSLFSVAGYFNADLPSALQNVLDAPSFSLTPASYQNNQLTTRYVIPTNTVSGLSHIEGKAVVVYADGIVVSSPGNTHPQNQLTSLEVSSGSITLPDYYGYGVVGLPYAFEMETLPIEAAGNETYSDAKKAINAIGAAFYRILGGYQGTEAANFDVAKMAPIQFPRRISVADDDPPYTGHAKNLTKGNWQDEGKVTIKQVDPLPITVLSVYPKGVAGG